MRMTKTAFQNKGFPLAGLLSNVMVQDSAKYFAQFLTNPNVNSAETLAENLTKPDIGTARNGVSRQVRAIEENFPSFTTRGGKVLLQSPREGGSLCNSTRTGESKAGATMPDNAIHSPVLIPSETSKGEFCESIKKGCDEFSDSIKKGSTADSTPLIYEQSAKKRFGHSSVLRRCNSLRATSTICRISSPALVPISSTRANASRAASRFDSALPSSWRRAISPCIAVTIKPALLSSSSFTASIASITACGTRTVVSCDLAFLLGVAITETPLIWCVSIYTKIEYIKTLMCISIFTIVRHTLSTGKAQEVPKIAKPGSASTLTGPLTTTDKQVSRQLCQIVPHPIRGGHHSARTNSPGVFSLSIATTKRPSLAVCPLRLKPNEKHGELLHPTSSSLWLPVCQYWEGNMLKTYDLTVDPTERTGQLISLAELMRDVLESDSNNREEYLAALISLFEISIRDLHWLLAGNLLPENSDITTPMKGGDTTTVQEVNHA